MSDDLEPGADAVPDGSGGADGAGSRKGPLAWFARNSVAANILMILLVVGGLTSLGGIKQEVFPEFDLDKIVVQVPYPGASPEEVERGVLLAVEEAVRSLDGVKEVSSTAREGLGVATISLKRGEKAKDKRADIEAAINRITSFPEDAEKPNVFEAQSRWEVISLVISGDQTEGTLRALAERARDDLLNDPRISLVELAGVRDYEISIEVSQENLRRYDLTLDEIAGIIRAAAVELPGGGIKTERGEVLIRTTERRLYGYEFEDIALISRPDGSTVTVGDIATVRDAFAETDQKTDYNGKPAAMIRIYRTGDEKPLEVAAAVKEYVAENADVLPPGISMDTWFDNSVFYEQRINLLLRNAMIGLILVIFVLGIFLDVKLAFWVTLGIPISFLGAFLLLPSTDVSVNMLSLFAFIQVLGMVVDDAIVVGEAVHTRRQAGARPLEAAIAGVREVAVPVTFAIVTTVVMYSPMLFIPGLFGKFFRVIPVVVIIVLILSLVESLLILPAHLAHSKPFARRGVLAWLHRRQERFAGYLQWFIDRAYRPTIEVAVERRYLTMAIAIGVLVASFGLLAGGRIEKVDFPDIDSDVVAASARMPYGASLEQAREVEEAMQAAADELFAELGGRDELAEGVFSQIGQWAMTARSDPSLVSAFDRGAHLIEVAVYMVESGQRPIRSAEFARRWREKLDRVAGLESLSFNFATGPASGSPVQVDLTHPNYATLRVAASTLAERLKEFEGTYDINDGFETGKEQIDFELTPEARSLGVTEISLASQLRSAFFGAEAVRQQRGRDEVRTYVRLPREERESEYYVEEYMIRTPAGGELPLAEAATMERGRSYTKIKRIDGRRVLSVTSAVDADVGSESAINARLASEVLPELAEEFPGLGFAMGGQQKEFKEASSSLDTGFMLALLGVFALLAVAFKSYTQPILIMLAIPFGFVGALWGHFILGYDYSMMSQMGVVALAGVVVNDSLILIVAINTYREEGMSIHDAIVAGGMRRFRPILLTSLTTFFGLVPMLLETEVQAQFLIPMAVSLGFGVMAATGITLVIVPASYRILEDAKVGVRWVKSLLVGPEGSAQQTDP